MMKKLEDYLIRRGYSMIDEHKPFRIYEKHNKRLVYHIASGKIWGHFQFKENYVDKFFRKDGQKKK